MSIMRHRTLPIEVGGTDPPIQLHHQATGLFVIDWWQGAL
jgi:hypothetical protein